MTQAPQPLPRTPLRPLSSRPATNAPSSSSHGLKVDIKTLGEQPIFPSLNAARERILLAGDTNSGKTYAYYKIAESHPDATFFVIDTDDTAPTFMAPGYSFEHLYFENGGNIKPFYAPDWKMIARVGNHIIQNAKPGDWIIVDLVSSAYSFAQEFIAGIKGLNLDDEMVKRMGVVPGTKRLGFGAFDGDTWGLVSRTFEATMRPLINNPKCNFIGLAHVTDMQTTAGRETREPILLFDQLGMKPTGVGKTLKMVNTCVVLWSYRPLNEDKQSGEIVRQMTVVKDRDKACYYSRPYDEFLPDLQTFRKTISHTRNVTDEEQAAKIREEVLNSLDEQKAAALAAVEDLTLIAKALDGATDDATDTTPEANGSAQATSPS